jgi:hypothetical protein
MALDLQNIRHDAAGRARRRARRERIVHFSPDCPSDWRPTSVINPATQRPFDSDDQAWNFIADCLDAGTEISVVELEMPFGNNHQAFVMIAQVGEGQIYMKFQLGASQIIGRSFHYSTK